MGFSLFYGRGSGGIVRGIQVAEFLDAKKNPKTGYQDDVCIFNKKMRVDDYPKRTYLDIVDAPRAEDWAKEHRDTGIIAISDYAKEYLTKTLNRNDIVVIPHHHCNYERFHREERPVKVVGIIGSANAFQYPLEEFRSKVEALGLTLRFDQPFYPLYDNNPNALGRNGREKVCNFYKDIDIQVVWRPEPWSARYDFGRNPLKLINAGSFGIPSISFPEPCYVRDWKGNFLESNSIDEMADMIRMLRDYPLVYKTIGDKAIEKSEEYHMEHIKQLYLNL